jgi:hypothetical protein
MHDTLCYIWCMFNFTQYKISASDVGVLGFFISKLFRFVQYMCFITMQFIESTKALNLHSIFVYFQQRLEPELIFT